MSTVVDLSALGPSGFVINGDAAHDNVGASLSNAGDINGDGFDDIIIGARAGGGNNDGMAYVVFGHAGGFGSIDLGGLQSSDGFVIQRSATSNDVGTSVSAAGDVNGDGFDDILVSTTASAFYYTGPSHAYLIFGHSGGFDTINLSNLTSPNGFVINQAAGFFDNQLIVADAGDINGDGFDDIIVGNQSAFSHAGAAWVIFGKAAGFGPIDLGNVALADGFKIAGPTGTRTGVSVSGAGDINGDGFDDVIVGAYFGNYGGIRAGQAYVIFGHADSFSNIGLADLGPNQGFLIQGDIANDWAGFSVSSAGDVNGDGFADVIIGAPLGDDGGNGAGEAYVIFGHAGAFGTPTNMGFNILDLSNLGAAGFKIQGDVSGDAAGWSVSGAGDVNGDGFDDLLVGAPFGDDGGTYAGEAYVIYGRPTNSATIDLTNLSAADGFIIEGDPDDRAGQSVSAAGDVNGDGVADILIGARTADPGGTDSGAAYIIFGQGSVVHDPTSDFNDDGFSDLLWRHDDGRVVTLLGQSNGSFVGNVNFNLNPGLDWHVEGIGDFNGDGNDDILWRNDIGTVVTLLGQDNGAFVGNVNFNLNPGLDWHIEGTGDFNRDGNDDILWRNDIGNVVTLLGQDNGAFVGNVSLNLNPGLDWHIEGTGDFNGDHFDDILWRNDSGAVMTLLGEAGGSFEDNVNFSLNPGLDWHVAGTGDFNDDGRDDILWRNDLGTITDLLGQPNGSFVGNVANLNVNPGTNWQVDGIGDYNGDGRDDILLRDNLGNTVDWLGLPNGAFADNSAIFNLNPGTDWQVQPDPSLGL